MTHIVGAGDLRHGFAGVAPRYSVALLIRGQFGTPAQLDATSFGPRSTFSCAGADQFSFELSEAA
jgi:hypothetical protein